MKLLESGRIGGLSLKNRVIMTPMGMYGIPEPDGTVGARAIRYFTERARGGAGLIFPAAALVTTEHEGTVGAIYALDSFDKVLGWSRLAGEVHHYGAKLGAQLSPGFGRINVSYFFDSSRQPVSASAVPAYWTPWIECRPLTREEIERIIAAFGVSAGLAKAAGVDVVEIHGYGGYLLDQFMSSRWNSREDEYGGDLAGRMRLALKVVDVVKGVCGEDVPVVFKFTPVHAAPGGRELPEGLAIAKMLVEAGVDALHVDVGCYEAWHKAIPPIYSRPGAQAEIAGAVREAVSIPVITNGRLGDPKKAEAVLREGKADFIGLGRPLLADPRWPDKVATGADDLIVPCIGCCEGCLARGFAGRYASCAVNPECGMEGEYPLEAANVPGRVLVVGGGPGGLTAAAVAARRGYDVELWEKADRPGGSLLAACAPSFKKDIARLTANLVTAAERDGARIRFGVTATVEDIMDYSPDFVVIAIGGEPVFPDIPGINGNNVIPASVLMSAEGPPEGDRFLVAGGGVVGCEAALFLAERGKEVVLAEREETLMGADPPFMLNRAALEELLAGSDIEVLTSTALKRVEPDGATLQRGGKKKRVSCDAVVIALGFRARTGLAEALEVRGVSPVSVGDAVNTGKVIDAVWQAFHAARVL